ncbi:MAG: hypothetical protein SVV80_12870 [Planctomycetota bacterium]|nr:hypothetical protein [Planctomycetota bacterium]
MLCPCEIDIAGGMFANAVEMMATVCFRRCHGVSSGLDFRFRYDKFTLLRKQAGLWAATYYDLQSPPICRVTLLLSPNPV